MSAVNLSWFFNAEYYGEFFNDESHDICIENKIIRNAKPALKKDVCAIPGILSFELQVEYPGLIAGVGYPHSAGVKSEICAGCSLDYVTGLPYLPGSSVKGLLRSAFDHENYIKEILEDDSADIKAMIKEIFGNEDAAGTDIFFDSYPVDGVCNGIFDIENITPHHQNEELGTLAEPNPLTFVKVKPGVVYKFDFILKDNDCITAEKKFRLFKQIILDLGMGAKTNVGFGRFTDEIKPVVPARSERPTAPAPAPSGYGEGKCKNCGRPVGMNYKTNKWHNYCRDCNNQIRR